MDTVAIDDPTTWNTNPFNGDIIGDRIYGRGAADMKSGLAAQVIALIELASLAGCGLSLQQVRNWAGSSLVGTTRNC